MKKVKYKAVICGFIFSILFSFIKFTGNCAGIENKIFRLHIIANSDSAEDQSLKLSVRDRILSDFGSCFSGASDVLSAEKITEDNLMEIENTAQNLVFEKGYNYPVKAKITHMYFNTRTYGDITIPAGYYDALRITIGDASGKNWWCVMFPPMCLPAAESHSELERVLNKDEMSVVEGESNYSIEFKTVDYYVRFQNFISEEKEKISPKIEEYLDDAPYEVKASCIKQLQDWIDKNFSK